MSSSTNETPDTTLSEVFFVPGLPHPEDYIHHSDDPISYNEHGRFNDFICKFSKGIDIENLETAGRLLYYVLLDASEEHPNHFKSLAINQTWLCDTMEDDVSVYELLKTCWETGAYFHIRRLSAYFATPNWPIADLVLTEIFLKEPSKSKPWKANSAKEPFFDESTLDVELEEDDM